MPRITFSLGVAPEHASLFTAETEASIRELAEHKLTCAIGSCGLTVGFDEVQVSVFEKLIAFAHEFELPLIVEAEGAYDEALEVLKRAGVPEKGVLLRGFDGTADELERWLEIDPYVSFDVRAADDPLRFSSLARQLSVERLLVESGAPRMTADKLEGYPPRADQVVFVADVFIGRCPAAQLAQNVKTLFG